MTNQIVGDKHTIIAGRVASFQGSIATHLAFEQMLDGTHVVQLCNFPADASSAQKQMARLAEASGQENVLDHYHTLTGRFASAHEVLSALEPTVREADRILFLSDLSDYLPIVPGDVALTVVNQLAELDFTVLTAVIAANTGAPLPDLTAYSAETVWLAEAGHRRVALSAVKPSADLKITFEAEYRLAPIWKENENV